MKSTLLALTIALSPVVANATAYTISDTAPDGFVLDDLAPYVGGIDFVQTDVGTWLGNASVYAAGDNVPGIRAGSNTNAFFSVESGESATLNRSSSGPIVVEVYSPDVWNNIWSGSASITGAALNSFPQLSTGGWAPIFVTLTGFGSGVNFTATQNALEFSIGHIVSGAPATPELSTWAMLGVGFASMAFLGLRKAKLAT